MNNVSTSFIKPGIEENLLGSASTLLQNLQDKHSRLMLIRLDCSFREEYQSGISFFDVSHYLHQLWNNRRHNSLFEHCLGWVWRIEYAEDCQYHAHLLFIYNGHNVQRDEYYGDAIGKYWANRITRGQGCYKNCNRNKDDYVYCGIGMIDRTKTADKFSNLFTYVLPYLAKESPLTRETIQRDANALGVSARGLRTFGCSC